MPRIEISSDLNELPRLVEFVEGFAETNELSMKVTMQLNLALEELVANVIQHGYAGSPGTIHLDLEREGELVQVVLIDRAPAYDPFSTAEPDLASPIAERSVGGLGVHLVREFADTFDYQRRGDENRVAIAMRV